MDSSDAEEVEYLLIVVFAFQDPSRGELVGSVGAADSRCGVVVVESTDAAEQRCAPSRGWMVQVDSADAAESHYAPSQGWMVQVDSADAAESHCAPSRVVVVVNLMSNALDLTYCLEI